MVITQKYISSIALTLALLVLSGPIMISFHHFDEEDATELSTAHDSEDEEGSECEVCDAFYAQVFDTSQEFDFTFLEVRAGVKTVTYLDQVSDRTFTTHTLRGPPVS